MQVSLWIKILPVFVCADAGTFNIEKHTFWNQTKEPTLIFYFRKIENHRVVLGNLMQKPQGSANFEIINKSIHHASREVDGHEVRKSLL